MTIRPVTTGNNHTLQVQQLSATNSSPFSKYAHMTSNIAPAYQSLQISASTAIAVIELWKTFFFQFLFSYWPSVRWFVWFFPRFFREREKEVFPLFFLELAWWWNADQQFEKNFERHFLIDFCLQLWWCMVTSIRILWVTKTTVKVLLMWIYTRIRGAFIYSRIGLCLA